jgi:ankyrin repeat protein
MMTRKDAERLVKKSNGNLCIRYYTDKNKKIALRDAPVQITRLGRRVSQFAASVFTAALSVSAVAAQGSARIAPETQTQTARKTQPEKEKISKSGASSIKGTIYDPSEAVVPGATVSLLDSAENIVYQTEANEEGVYEINYVQAGNYRLRIQSPGFQTHFTEIELQESDARTMDATLDVGAVAGGIGIGDSQISEWVRHTKKRDRIESVEEDEKLTEFFGAVESDELADVKQMLRKGFPINSKNSAGESALMKADSAEMAKYLLRRKADVNAVNSYNETALMLKATDAEIVKALLDAKADVNATSRFGVTALMYAMDNDDDADPVKLLLKAGADVNVSDIDGRTALMLAAFEGEMEIIRLLVESGANVNARDAKGKTVLMYAVEGNPGDEAENIRYLIENGADMNARESEGKSVLKLALEEEDEETIKLLKSYGAIE